MIKRLGQACVVLGVGSVVWLSWTTACSIPGTSSPQDPVAVAQAPDAMASTDDLCDASQSWKRRVYVNVTYESADPAYAVAIAHREFERREGQTSYVQSGAPNTSSSLNGHMPSGVDMGWITELDVGRVVNISNSDSPIQPELDQACERLRAVERGEEVILEAFKNGGDREATAVMLELHRNEVNNLRSRIRNLLQESRKAQVNLYFNPPAG